MSFLLRQQLGVEFRDAEVRGQRPRHRLAVSRKQGQVGNA
jgi:hypothetical protein